MRVLFLALGGSRKRAAVEESAQVVADGGQAVVLIDKAAGWRQVTFDPAVEVVDLAGLENRRLPLRIEQFLLFKAPRRGLRAVGRGPLRGLAGRAAGAYESRIADRVHRRVVLPAYRSRWGGVPLLRRQVLRDTVFDLMVVTDPVSMPYAARLLAGYDAAGDPPRLAFGLDYAGYEVTGDAGTPPR